MRRSDRSFTAKSVVPSPSVVLILGFAGSKLKHFRKLQEFYDSRNVNSVVQIMPLLCTPYHRENFFIDVERKIQPSLQCTSKFYVHIFSNNGCWAYSSLMKRGILPVPSKIVVDSAYYAFKADVNLNEMLSGFADVMTSIILRREVTHETFLSKVIKSILNISYPWIKVLPDVLSLNDYFVNQSPPLPALFIYSVGDKVIPPEKVQETIQQFEKRSYRIHQKVFGKDVPHVSSLRMYPDEYKAELEKFLFEK